MTTVKEYFANIIEAVRSTAVGMGITLRYWVKEPAITVEYPDRLSGGKGHDDIVFDRFRGYLNVDMTKCIGCLQCMKICPIDCIGIDIDRREKGRFITRFDIDQSRCMYCGLCVEECNMGAVTFTKRFEGACFRIDDLLMQHVNEPVPVAKPAAKKKEEAQG